MSNEELQKQEARRVRSEAEKCLRHASIILAKTAHEMDDFIIQLKLARIPVRRQAILNEAINHLATQLMPNLGLADLARVQSLLATRDYAPLTSEVDEANKKDV